MSIFARKFLFEADEESDPNLTNAQQNDSSGGEEEPQESDPNLNNDTEQPSEDNTEEAPTEEDTGEEEPTTDDEGEESSDEDFSIDDNMDMDDSGDDSSEGESDPNMSSDDSGDSSSEEETEVDPDSLKAKDAELFDSLPPEQQKQKLKVMKKMFLDLYTNAELIINKINNVSIEAEDVAAQLKRTLTILFELKKMIYDYVMVSFDNKSYIENDIMYTRYLSVFNSVKNITTDIKNLYLDDSEEVK